MTPSQMHVTALTEEYETLVSECRMGHANVGAELARDQLVKAMVDSADWTTEGAAVVIQLAEDYGVFMLRNALALAIALEIEDGDLGF